MFVRTRRALWSVMPAGLTGAFVVFAVGRAGEPEDTNRVGLLVLGWFYGVGILGLIRLFRVAPWCYPWVGFVCGPVPLALFVHGGVGAEERGFLLFLTALFGFLVGLIEWGRVRRPGADPHDPAVEEID